jgi:hypothetical protein
MSRLIFPAGVKWLCLRIDRPASPPFHILATQDGWGYNPVQDDQSNFTQLHPRPPPHTRPLNAFNSLATQDGFLTQDGSG